MLKIYINIIKYRIKHKIPLTDNMKRVWEIYKEQNNDKGN